MSLRKGEFVNNWRIGKIVPLLKSKEFDSQDPKSYRPVTIQATISKIDEKAVQNHTYRKLYSTTTAMMEIVDDIQENTDENKITAAMAIDESMTFDCVTHDVLLQKMEM